ncbi:MAG: Asp-tRNA(Asn)/Glu-tRNA(Gln) amidotransferase subunit GatB [Candidatus Pacebacteria bacterium]|nr:Asp-tRNA(Asn)/Glu-tRNA(Gln) amidotransferase subunit GatB [Candidatus Paceibacterota bacterium]
MSEKKYYTTVGLEVHAELKTQTKMFCNSKNDPDEERPNVNICPVCMGHPGTLPVVNKEAVKHVLKVGVAVGGELADFTEFDRKNYFYPDIPKGYQISQYKYPLVSGGELAGVKLTRVHLEEDTGTSKHEEGDFSLVDFNRAGVPLMELVTEPVIHSAEEATNFAKELQLLLRTLGAGEANMEKGEMRVEANISVSDDPKKFGTKVEVKNLNSFRSVGRAIEYEVERHIRMIEKGEKIEQETRGWDETKETTYSQRKKEDSHDYRYFPDPDIPKLWISEIPEFSAENLKKEMPELPWIKREKYKKYKLKPEEIEVSLQHPTLGDYIEELSREFKEDIEHVRLAANYLYSDILGILKSATKAGETFDFSKSEKMITPKQLAEITRMLKSGEISSRGAKDILAVIMKDGGDPKKIADEKGLIQKSDPEALKKIIEKIIADNPKAVSEYKAGKLNNLQFLIGQAMKETKGSANPALLKELFEGALK